MKYTRFTSASTLVNNPVNIFIAIILFFGINGCQPANSINYSFFVAGHAYGSLKEKETGLHPPFIAEFERINNNKKIELGFFTGDLIHFPDKIPYWEKAMEDIGKLNCETHIAPGNHEVAVKENFEKYIGRYYYAFEKNNDLFIVLNGNENNWNIEGEQLQFLKKTIAEKTAGKDHLFIFIHQLIWWQENTEFGLCTPNSFMSKSDSLNFHQDILPLFYSINKPVYLFAGDVGAYEDRCSIFHHKIKNVTLLASGMGNYKADNYLTVDVLENGKVEINIIGLNCETGNSCLGKIEDY